MPMVQSLPQQNDGCLLGRFGVELMDDVVQMWRVKRLTSPALFVSTCSELHIVPTAMNFPPGAILKST